MVLSTNIYCLSARNRERKKRKESQKTWLGAAEVQLGLAHWTVRCARPASGKQATLEKNRRRTTIIHRTVRWCTGLSDEPTVTSATIGSAIRGRRVARANGRQGASDCPVCQLARSCNGRLRQKRKEIDTGPSTVTVRWRTRLSSAPLDRRQGWPFLLASNGS
jgi:hypothetical protein